MELHMDYCQEWNYWRKESLQASWYNLLFMWTIYDFEIRITCWLFTVSTNITQLFKRRSFKPLLGLTTFPYCRFCTRTTHTLRKPQRLLKNASLNALVKQHSKAEDVKSHHGVGLRGDVIFLLLWLNHGLEKIAYHWFGFESPVTHFWFGFYCTSIARRAQKPHQLVTKTWIDLPRKDTKIPRQDMPELLVRTLSIIICRPDKSSAYPTTCNEEYIAKLWNDVITKTSEQ